MQPMKQLRLWHMMIAVLAVAAYLTEGEEPWHQLLGYGVGALIAIRLLMALFGSRQLGLQRFYPQFHDLKIGTAATHPAISRVLLLGIAICLLGVTTTGILMDQGKTLQSIPAASGSAMSGQEADDDDERHAAFRQSNDSDEREEHDEDGEDGLLGEVHELFANLLIALVALHVSYLVLFKWPLARFMLFIRQRRKAPDLSTRP